MEWREESSFIIKKIVPPPGWTGKIRESYFVQKIRCDKFWWKCIDIIEYFEERSLLFNTRWQYLNFEKGDDEDFVIYTRSTRNLN